MEGCENHEPLRFFIEVNVPRGGQKLAVLRLHHSAILQSAAEANVDLHYITVCFNQLFCMYVSASRRLSELKALRPIYKA